MPYRGTRIVWRGAEVTAAMREGAARGLNRSANALLGIVTPFTPYLSGDLQRGYGIFEATPETVEQGAQLQNSVEYAAFQHEGGDGRRVINEAHRSHDPHAQAMSKFVEKPMRDHADELQAIIAADIAASLQ